MKKLRELLIGDTIYEVNPLEQLSVNLNSDEIIINGDNNNGDSIMSVTIPQATALKAGVVGTDLFNLIHKNANLIENIPDLIQDVVAITNTETETCNFLKRDVVINSYGKNILQIGGNIVKNLVDGTFVSGWTTYVTNTSSINSGITAIISQGVGGVKYVAQPIKEHLYYLSISCRVLSGELTALFGNALVRITTTDWCNISVRGKSQNASSVFIRNDNPDAYINALVKNVLVIDLTEMFGAGNEPTKEECDIMFSTMDALPQGLTIAQPTGLKSTGYNQWNPDNTLINKTITGNAIVDGDKNIAVVECLPCKVGAGENNGYVIGYGEGDSWSDEGVEVYLSPLNPMEIEGELYMSKLEKDATYGTYVPQIKGYLLVVTPTTDRLCAHLHWSGDRAKTDYEEYADSNIAIPAIPQMSEWGLAGISSSGTMTQDTIDLDRMVYTKRIGCVDLGSLSWKAQKQTLPIEYVVFFTDDIIDAKVVMGTRLNAVSAIYTTVRNGGVASTNGVGSLDKSLCFSSSKRLLLRNDAYVSATDFKQAMQGVMFYYELAEPEEYPIVIQSSITYISGNSEEIIGSKIPVNVILNLGDKRSLVTETTKFLDLLYENTNTNNAKETADVITNALLLAILTLEISPNEDDVELDLINTLGTYNHVVLPAATIEKAGVMSAAQFQNLATLMIQMQDLIARVEALENQGVVAKVSSNVLTFTKGAEVETNNLSLTGNNIDIINNNLNI